MNIKDYKRIVVVGNSGSGKSHFSKVISEITGLPLIHLDVEFWRPNWEKTPKSEFISRQKEIIGKENWIIDGTYCSTLELRYEAADLIIFMDTNRFVCLYRVIKRSGTKRSDLPEYLDEKFNFFNKDSIQHCRIILNFNKKDKQFIMELNKKYCEKPLLIINSKAQLNRFIKEWKNNKNIPIM